MPATASVREVKFCCKVLTVFCMVLTAPDRFVTFWFRLSTCVPRLSTVVCIWLMVDSMESSFPLTSVLKSVICWVTSLDRASIRPPSAVSASSRACCSLSMFVWSVASASLARCVSVVISPFRRFSSRVARLTSSARSLAISSSRALARVTSAVICSCKSASTPVARFTSLVICSCKSASAAVARFVSAVILSSRAFSAASARVVSASILVLS